MTSTIRPSFARTQAVLQCGLSDGVASALVGGVWSAQSPHSFEVFSVGKTAYGSSAISVSEDTVFDCASVTKGVVTATTLARLIDRGWLDWDTPVQAVLPDYPFSNVLVSHLLTHSAGYPAWLPFWKEMSKQWCGLKNLRSAPISEHKKCIWQRLIQIPLEAIPGQQTLYSDLGFIILGFIIEAVNGQPLGHSVQKMVFDPLEMKSSHFRPIQRTPSEELTIPTTADQESKEISVSGEVHDENCWAVGGIAGHAGLFSDAKDLLKFSRGLLTGFLSKEQFYRVSTRCQIPERSERTMGWDTPSSESPSCGKLFSKQSFGHLGFTGTSLWMDVLNRRAVVLLTNRVHPTRENIKIRAFRPTFHDAILSDLIHN